MALTLQLCKLLPLLLDLGSHFALDVVSFLDDLLISLFLFFDIRVHVLGPLVSFLELCLNLSLLSFGLGLYLVELIDGLRQLLVLRHVVISLRLQAFVLSKQVLEGGVQIVMLPDELFVVFFALLHLAEHLGLLTFVHVNDRLGL